MQQTDVVIAGGGVIGMSLALELRRHGRRVTLVERGTAGTGASSAAAGMLAANDPANPAAMRPLSELSLSLYPAFLGRLAQLVPRHPVSFETGWTLERGGNDPSTPLPEGIAPAAGNFCLLREQSLDPRRLVAALVSAVKKSGVKLLEGTALRSVEPDGKGTLRVLAGEGSISSTQFVDCTGAWSGTVVRPVKGQMLRVTLGSRNPSLPGRGNVVLRGPSIYLVPRLDGTALIGASLEEKGFCVKTKDSTIADLRARAAHLYPAAADAPEIERWAGLRPATADGRPVLGALPGTGRFVAAGHFRNGILLAPATAHVMAQLLLGEKPELLLNSYLPSRFAR